MKYKVVNAATEENSYASTTMYPSKEQAQKVCIEGLDKIKAVPETPADRTALWLEACGKEKTFENASVQIGCVLEEMQEFIKELCLDKDSVQEEWQFQISSNLGKLGNSLKRRDVVTTFKDPEQAIDHMTDLKVTVDGVAYLSDFDINQSDQNTLQANDNKLIDGKPVLLPGGKIGKPVGWKAPDHSDCVGSLYA